MNENTKIILGVFAGLAAGAALGLLLAPEKGSDSRDDRGLSLNDRGSNFQHNDISLGFDQDDYNDHVEHV